MRFGLRSVDRAKKLAHDLHDHLCSATLADCQLLSAQLYGYRDWHELDIVTRRGAEAASAWDEQLEPGARRDRFEYQLQTLESALGITHRVAARSLLLSVSPTRREALRPVRRAEVAVPRGEPGMALCSQLIFRQSDGAALDSLERFGFEGVLDSSDDELNKQVVPATVRTTLSAPRAWGETTVQSTDLGLSQTTVFRHLALDEGDTYRGAAVWSLHLSAAPGSLPSGQARLERAWAEGLPLPAGRTQPGVNYQYLPAVAQAFTGHAAWLRWRQWLACWSPQTCVRLRQELERHTVQAKSPLSTSLAGSLRSTLAPSFAGGFDMVVPSSELSPVVARKYFNHWLGTAQRQLDPMSLLEVRLLHGKQSFRLTFDSAGRINRLLVETVPP